MVQPAASTQALFEAVEDGLVGEKHHQDPQGCRDRARVKMFFHEHQEPIESQRLHQLLTCSAGGHEEQMSSSDDSQSAFLLKIKSNGFLKKNVIIISFISGRSKIIRIEHIKH